MLHLCLLTDISVATKACYVTSLGVTSFAAGNNHLGIFPWCNRFLQTAERGENRAQGCARAIDEGDRMNVGYCSDSLKTTVAAYLGLPYCRNSYGPH